MSTKPDITVGKKRGPYNKPGNVPRVCKKRGNSPNHAPNQQKQGDYAVAGGKMRRGPYKAKESTKPRAAADMDMTKTSSQDCTTESPDHVSQGKEDLEDVVLTADGQSTEQVEKDEAELETGEDHGEHFADDEDDVIDDDESTAENQDIGDEDRDEDLIYPGAQLTISVSMLLITTFCLQHGLTAEASSNLLLLIQLHCLPNNSFHLTTSLINDLFMKLKSPIQYYYVCNNCKSGLGCDKPLSCTLCESKDIMYFIMLPFQDQLSSLLAKPGMKKKLKHRSNRKKRNQGAIEDVYDGTLYKRHFDSNGYFRGSSEREMENELHLSLQINTDGVAIFRSSKFSLWPLYATLNELPPKERFQKQNRLLVGLYFGKEKPNMKVFLQPFVKDMNSLYRKGVDVEMEKESKRVRAIVLSNTVDAPARCMLLDSVQFNGHYGCPCCYDKGETHTANGGRSHIYPYNTERDSGHSKVRTHDGTKKLAEGVQEQMQEEPTKAKPVLGFKGKSALFFLPHFDVIDGTSIDYMHCVLLGVVKRLLHLWIDAAYRKEPWSIRKHMSAVSQRLLNITPPSLLSRMPQSLENLYLWKASEIRSFLLYYAIPVLAGILPVVYYDHFVLLVQGIYLLNQESVTQDDLQRATNSLKLFCKKMGELYSPRHMTFNVHCLLHLGKKVELLGPLWCHSCFFYESINGDLRKMFHGTTSILSQITVAVSKQIKMVEMQNMLKAGSLAEDLYKKLTIRNYSTSQRQTVISCNAKAIGAFLTFQLDDDIGYMLQNKIGEVEECLMFKRLLLNGIVYQSKNYRGHKRNNYTVLLSNGQYVSVMMYLICKSQGYTAYFAVVKHLDVSGNGGKVQHISEVSEGNLDIVSIDEFRSLCVFMSIIDSGKKFVACFPNTFECD